MIRIDRASTEAPDWLPEAEARGLQALRSILRERQLLSEDFDREIFAHPEVKESLRRMQHLKCCYCERRSRGSYNDVEHFRPKAEARRDKGSQERHPGYWWLAYRFDNLYFACAECNRGKGAGFPLVPGTSPLVPEQDPRLVPEQPLLLDPGHDAVEEHLLFVRAPSGRYRFAPRNGSPRGQRTLEIVGLDSDALDELRDQYFLDHLLPLVDEFKAAREAGDAARQERVRQRARDLARPQAEFSLLARAVFADAGLLTT